MEDDEKRGEKNGCKSKQESRGEGHLEAVGAAAAGGGVADTSGGETGD
jgi:hypothetical protein